MLYLKMNGKLKRFNAYDKRSPASSEMREEKRYVRHQKL